MSHHVCLLQKLERQFDLRSIDSQAPGFYYFLLLLLLFAHCSDAILFLFSCFAFLKELIRQAMPNILHEISALAFVSIVFGDQYVQCCKCT